MIPKVIHYVWIGKGVKNLLIQKCMQSWYTFQQEWEIKCWNEDNLPLSHPYVQLALDHKQYAFASYYLRIYILLSYGGIYLDTDMEIIRPLDDLMNNQAFI